MDAHGTGTDGRKRRMKQRYLDTLPAAVTRPCEQRHDDADDSLKGGVVGSDRDGRVDRAVGIGRRRTIGRRGGSDNALEGTHLGARIIGGKAR
jgi:hypothetical protein